MTDGWAAVSASRTDPRSRRSTADHVTRDRESAFAPSVLRRAWPRWAHACTGPWAASRSSRWPPANPVAPVMSGTPGTRSAAAVLALVVLAELGVLVLDRPPPPLVVAVPRDSFREALFERLPRPPAERLQLRGVERVAAIVAGTIGHRLDQRVGLADERQDPVRQVHVLDVVAAADVVDLAGRPPLDQQIDGAAM